MGRTPGVPPWPRTVGTHRPWVWRDDTALIGHPFAWRAQCSCRGLPRDPGWQVAWNGLTQQVAFNEACRHLEAVSDSTPTQRRGTFAGRPLRVCKIAGWWTVLDAGGKLDAATGVTWPACCWPAAMMVADALADAYSGRPQSTRTYAAAHPPHTEHTCTGAG